MRKTTKSSKALIPYQDHRSNGPGDARGTVGCKHSPCRAGWSGYDLFLIRCDGQRCDVGTAH